MRQLKTGLSIFRAKNPLCKMCLQNTFTVNRVCVVWRHWFLRLGWSTLCSHVWSVALWLWQHNYDDDDYSRYISLESCIIWRYFRITTVAMHRIESFLVHFSLNLLSLDLMVQHQWMDNSVIRNILRFLVFTCVNEKVSAFSSRNQYMNNSF